MMDDERTVSFCNPQNIWGKKEQLGGEKRAWIDDDDDNGGDADGIGVDGGDDGISVDDGDDDGIGVDGEWVKQGGRSSVEPRVVQ